MFEGKLATEVAREFLKEQRRSRRWGIFFKALFALYVLGFFVIYMAGKSGLERPGLGGDRHTALIEVEGVIGPDSMASADNVVSGLRAAFKDKNTAGIILRINSPGGSPVQAGYINDEIFRLREKHPDIPVYAVISDVCASGGYYIASAAEKIYADKASLVGSIGVVMAGFGFVEAIDKLGIERRVRHAGENKDFMDPF
ncbi:MAG: S49 family peptidase, partial [Gammaproteobacteria bacterium]